MRAGEHKPEGGAAALLLESGLLLRLLMRQG
jgi:hypothetical protein